MRGSELHPQTPQHLNKTIHKICEQVKFRFLGQVFKTWLAMVFLMLSHESRFWLANVMGLGREPIAVKLDWTAVQGLKILKTLTHDCLSVIWIGLNAVLEPVAAF